MTPLLRRPILIGGLGLTASAWMLHSVGSSLHDFSGVVVWGTIALGSGLWWLNRQGSAKPRPSLATVAVDRTTVEQAIATVDNRINQLATEAAESAVEVVASLRQQLAQVQADLDRQQIRVAVMGGASVGKTTVAQQLAAAMSLSQPVQEGSTLTEVADADLILFVTAGDLTESEVQTIQELQDNKHRVLLLFNKQDQYLPADRPVILQQLRDKMQGLLGSEDILAISAQPAPIKVRQQQADGTLQERIEQPAPVLTSLTDRLNILFLAKSQALVLATGLRQAYALNRLVQRELNHLRRERAMPVIEQYQWIAAAAAFTNPVPSLDLLATATVTAQLVVDLGAIYQQSFSLDQAKTVMGNLAAQMVQLGLVEMASQAIAPLLKSHALTYVAGGTIQGLSAAYLTRLAGLSLMEYFEERSQEVNSSTESFFQIDRLVEKLKVVFQDNQRSVFVQNLVKQGISRLLPEAVSPVSVES